MHAVGSAAPRRRPRVPLTIALLACTLASAAPAQDVDPTLAPPLVDEAHAFTIQLPTHLAEAPPRASWIRRSFEHVDPAVGREVITVGVLGPTAEVLPVLDGFKVNWAAEWRVLREQREPDPVLGDRANAIFERMSDGDIAHLRFYSLKGWVWVLGMQFPRVRAAAWDVMGPAVTRTFRVTGDPLRTPAMPEMGNSFLTREDLGLVVQIPTHTEPKLRDIPSTWIRAVFSCPNGDRTASEVSIGFSEAGEPFANFCTFVRAEFERQRIPFERDVAREHLPPGVGAAYAFADPGVQTMYRVYLLERAGWTTAIVFRFVTTGYERERLWFCREFIRGLKFTGTPTVLAPRAPKLTLAMGALQRDHALGIEYRVPEAAQPAPVTDARMKLAFAVTHPDHSTGTVHVSEAAAGESLPELARAMERIYRAAGAEPAGPRTAGSPELGAVAYLRMDATAAAMVYHLHFFQQAERTFCVSVGFKADFEELWRGLAPPVLLGFRVTRVPEIWVEPPPAAQHDDGDGFRLSSAAVGLAARARKVAQDDLAVGIGAMRKLLDGPALAVRVTAHLFTDARPLQRVWGGADTPPAAFYFPSARLILARGDKEGLTDAAGAARRVAAARAYGDDRFGTAHGMPPWARVGLDEAASAARAAGKDGVEVALRHSPLAKWIRANKRKAGWPDVDAVVRKGRALEGEADRAYAFALVLAAEASADPAIHGVLRRFAATLAETRRPADALEAALKGVDLPAWDKAALAILDRA